MFAAKKYHASESGDDVGNQRLNGISVLCCYAHGASKRVVLLVQKIQSFRVKGPVSEVEGHIIEQVSINHRDKDFLGAWQWGVYSLSA